ncbi:glycosyltransferase [bacterium]|nr:glycosyltransferase [bacterium]
MAKVSIIIPVYGVEKFLRECLDSVLNQTLEDMEILLLDDGGKDKCPEIIDEYAQKDSRIVAIHKKNGGYGHTCNMGLERATGEYVAIVEPDDFIDKDMYQDLYNVAVENDADVVRSNYIENFDLGKDSYQKLSPDNVGEKPQGVFTLKEFPVLFDTHPSIWTCLFKREFLNKHNIKFVEAPGAGWTDNPFQIQTFCLAERMVYVDKAYYYWRKLNLKDENDLRDFTIPFKRTKEIHDWLKENNITDEGILANLYRREIGYFHILHKMLKFKDIKAYSEYLKEYLSSLDYTVVEKSDIIKPREKRFLKKLKRCYRCAILQDKFKAFKDYVFKFRWKKEQKYLYLFDNCVFRLGV